MLVMFIIVMCPITLDILQHMRRNIQGEEFNLKMICITIYIIIINTIINTWSILTMLDNDSAPPSGGVDYNCNMDPDPINDMYNQEIIISSQVLLVLGLGWHVSSSELSADSSTKPHVQSAPTKNCGTSNIFFEQFSSYFWTFLKMI